MGGQRQGKLGWIGGWMGGFLWVLILAVVMLVQGKWIHGVAGLLITGMAGATALSCAPWRHPKTPYRVLMLPVYMLLFVAIAWAVWIVGDPRQIGFNSWWALFLLLPAFLPLWTAGNRRWGDDR